MLPNLTIEEAKLKSDHNPLSIDSSIADLEDFCSSFLDLDSIKDWVEEGLPMDDVAVSNPNMEKADFFEQLGDLGTLIQDDMASSERLCNLEKDCFTEKNLDLGSLIEGDIGGIKLRELTDELGNGESLGVEVPFLKPKLEKSDSVEKLGDLGTLMGEDMGKVKVVELRDDTGVMKSEKVESDESSSDSESESQSGSESFDSSSSSEEEDDDDDDDVEKVKEKVDMEDGEINNSDAEKMMGWSDDEFGDEDGGVSKGPIKSRNELKDLPHVPPVEASLQPHHQTVPVGVISSIIDAQVIVEGVEQHNPLNEGTIFWVTESRSPLGIVDEIFGPVKSPFYIIRYNSENEVPEGIKQGTSISFVPEFANHVLKDNLYKKGYDASGENDEEVSDDYEFSDDEQEAEFRKLQKMKKKRGTNESNDRNEFKERKNYKNRGGGSSQHNQFFRNSSGSFQNNAPQGVATQVPTNQNQHCVTGQSYGNAPSFNPPFQQTVQAPGFIPQTNAVWMNGVPGQQNMVYPNGMPGHLSMVFPNGMPGQQGTIFPNGMPGQQVMVFPNGMIWPQQNLLANGVPFPQQFAPNQNFPQNVSGAPSFGPWSGPLIQNGPNQQLGVGMPMNVNGQQCPPNQGNMEMPRELNQGAHRSGGRGTHHRGGGRFRGGRGRHQAK